MGADHEMLITPLDNLASLYTVMGRYPDAEPLYQRALRIAEKGPEHGLVARTTNNLALLYEQLARYSEAEQMLKKALSINEKIYGLDEEETAVTLNNLAELYRKLGRFDEAEPLYQRVLSIDQKRLGAEHPEIARTLNNLGLLYSDTGRFKEAEDYYRRAIAMHEKTQGPDPPDLSTPLQNLAGLMEDTGRFGEAEALYLRALNIEQAALGPEHSSVAVTQNNLALLYFVTGEYEKAESLYRQALQVQEKSLGMDHPDVAVALVNLAALNDQLGRYEEVEPLYKRALQIQENSFGPDHPTVSNTRVNLALLYLKLGRVPEAEHLLQLSSASYEKYFHGDHPLIANTLSALASIAVDQRDFVKAEDLYRRELEIDENFFGPAHPRTASAMSSLAALYDDLGRYQEAEKLYTQALSIQQFALRPGHPQIASTLHNLGELSVSLKRYRAAEAFLNRSLSIVTKCFGEGHPDAIADFYSLAVLNARINRNVEAHRFFRKTVALQSQLRERVFSGLTEQQQLSLLQTHENTMHAHLTHTVVALKGNSQALRETFEDWLQWKGTVQEAQGRFLESILLSSDEETKQLWRSLQEMRRRIARLWIGGPGEQSPDAYRQQVAGLEKQREDLEGQLSRRNSVFAAQKQSAQVSLAQLTANLPPDALYLDYAFIRLQDLVHGKQGSFHYCVFALRPNGILQMIDLGEAAAIDRIIAECRDHIQRAQQMESFGQQSRALYDALLKPVTKLLRDSKRLFISADGSLHSLPFEVLLDPTQRYLMDSFEINYVSTGRDILRWNSEGSAGTRALLFADPAYDESPASMNGTGRRSMSRSFGGIRFEQLPGTRTEGEAIASTLGDHGWDVTLYMQKDASESQLNFDRPPRVLHFATHGFFLQDQNSADVKDTRGVIALQPEDPSGTGLQLPMSLQENPLARSGIVLAGANHSLQAGEDEGILTADKVLSLNLHGTDLVVLSACETGLGDVRRGEGVFGLKRAFILAGARTVIMSLWKVSDEATRQFMTTFYSLWSSGSSKGEALRQARHKLQEHYSSPYYWAAFILVGDAR